MNKLGKNILKELNLIEKNDLKVFIKCSIIVLLQILSFFYKPFVFVELAYVCVFLIFEKNQNKILYLLFLLPFYNVFRYGNDNTQYNQILNNFINVYFSVWVLLLFVILFTIRYIKDLKDKKKSIKWNKVICFVVLYILLFVPQFNVISDFSMFLVVTALFATLYLVFEYKEELNLKRMANFWLFGVIFSIFIYLFKDFLPNLTVFNITFFPNRFNGLLRDPNYWAFEVLTLLLVYTVLFFNNHIKTLFPFVFVILALSGILSQSKSFFIAFVIYFVILAIMLIIKGYKYYKSKNNSKHFYYILFLSLAIISVVCFVIFILFKELFIAYLNRLFEFISFEGNLYEKLNNLTTGRYGIWLQYLSSIISSFLMLMFGRGVCNGYEFDAIHNTFLQIFYFGGLLFCVLVLIWFVKSIIKHKKTRKFINYLPLLILSIMACSIDLLFSYRLYIILIFVSLTMDCVNNEYSVKEESKINNPKISIVVPVYKVEKYLDKCVSSILNQPYKNLELILVDDKSPDTCGEMCDEWKKKDKRVKVIHHKVNSGVSMARNSGLKLATGDYITFVDSDDFVTNDFSRCVENLEDVDITCAPYFEKRNLNIKIKIPLNDWKDQVVEDLNEGCISSGSYNSLWLKFFKADFIRQYNLILDKNLRIAEDLKFTLEAFKYAERVQFCGIPYYIYNINDTSLMANVSYEKILNTLEVCEYGADLVRDIKDTNLKSFMKKLISENLLSVLNRVGNYTDEQNKILINRLIKLKKSFVYGSTIFKKILIIVIRMLGIKTATKILRLRGNK